MAPYTAPAGGGPASLCLDKNPLSVASEMDDRERLLVVGNGMASYRFCTAGIERGLIGRYRVQLIGAEPYAAYDRVNLHHVLFGKPLGQLALSPASWYREQGLDLELGYRVEEIDRENRRLSICGSEPIEYDRLILATGASARLPEIPGIELDRVFCYRSYDDVCALTAQSRVADKIVILGGGVLALELAEVLSQRSGLRVQVIERSAGLCSRQLHPQTGSFLAGRMQALGIEVTTDAEATGILETDSGLQIALSNGQHVTADLVAVAVGIVPRDELARDAGLETLPTGGVVVDENLSTSDPQIHAIGDCASYQGRVSGLVAEAWEMADCLAARLCGQQETYQARPAPLISKADALEVGVIALGESQARDPELRRLSFQRASVRREFVLRKRRVVGAASVGEWPELESVQNLVEKQGKLSRFRRLRFRLTGRIASSRARHVSFLPETAIICHCMGVTRATLESAWQSGSDSQEALTTTTGAGGVCGSCRQSLLEFCGDSKRRRLEVWTLKFFWTSVLSLVLVGVFVGSAPMQRTDPFQIRTGIFEEFLRHDYRTGTGYTIAGLFLLSMLISVRKRLPFAENWGSTAPWRTLHGCFTATGLALLVLHTGLRWGDNLAWTLLVTVILMSVTGGLYGLFARLEAQRIMDPTGNRHMQTMLFRSHVLLFAVLPVLLASHIISVLYY